MIQCVICAISYIKYIKTYHTMLLLITVRLQKFGTGKNIVDNLNVLRVELQFDIKVLHIYKEIVEYIFFENINFAMIYDNRCCNFVWLSNRMRT